ncbi:MAG: nitronate monooxygenase [Deltaproteobacteria bacterium]|nr:nitronate monooxygenase [Deltaproteobacteria bacterium]
MIYTRLCDLFGIELPIISAGMGGVACAALAAAVSEAGGLGTLGLAAFSREGIRNQIAAAQHRTRKPLAANLLVPFLRPGIVETVADARLAAVTFFWGDAREYVDAIVRLHAAGPRSFGNAARSMKPGTLPMRESTRLLHRASKRVAMCGAESGHSRLSQRCVMRSRTCR